MGRPVGASGSKTLAAIRRKAVARIYKSGFEATTLRQVAADVGVKAGSLYNYFDSKQDFLFGLLSATMTDLEAELETALRVATGPLDTLKRFIAFHIDFHTARKREVFIGNMELRSLKGRHYAEIIARRDRYEARLQSILETGNREGVWAVEDPRVTTFAVIAMLTGICTWFSPSGRLSCADLTRLYTHQILRGLDLRQADGDH
jgi:AcrR family transcriptional regulator